MRKILFITEGRRAEPLLLRVLWDKFSFPKNYEFYSYNTNLTVLTKEYYKEGSFDDDLDLIMLLREKGVDEKNRAALDLEYTDVFLIFDLDPHVNSFYPDRIREMMAHFSDSAGFGKLYINYPMLESWRDIRSENDIDFKDRTVAKADFSKYKHMVLKNNYSWAPLRNFSKTDRISLSIVIRFHLMKANYILTGSYAVPKKEDYLKFDFYNLLEKELALLGEQDMVHALCTALFCVIEYNPTKFFAGLYDVPA